MVAAYKSQVKENETLQATIKSLQAAASRKAARRPSQSEEDSEAENSREDEVRFFSELLYFYQRYTGTETQKIFLVC